MQRSGATRFYAVAAMILAGSVARCVRPEPSSTQRARQDAGPPSDPDDQPFQQPPGNWRPQIGHAVSLPADAHPLRREGLARFQSACCVGQVGCTPNGCPPALRVVDVSSQGLLSPPIIGRFLRLHAPTLDPCWWGVLARGGHGPARVEVHWTVDSGRNSDIQARTAPAANSDLEACFVDVMRRWEFPHGNPGATQASAVITFPAGGTP